MNPPVTDRRLRVVLVEDDDELRDLIREALEARGYTVISLEDGLELLDYVGMAVTFEDPLRAPRPDLILSDVRMPGTSVFDVLSNIRRVNASCPVVLMSAFADAECLQQAAQSGANTLMAKPVDLEALMECVESLLPA